MGHAVKAEGKPGGMRAALNLQHAVNVKMSSLLQMLAAAGWQNLLELYQMGRQWGCKHHFQAKACCVSSKSSNFVRKAAPEERQTFWQAQLSNIMRRTLRSYPVRT